MAEKKGEKRGRKRGRKKKKEEKRENNQGGLLISRACVILKMGCDKVLVFCFETVFIAS